MMLISFCVFNLLAFPLMLQKQGYKFKTLKALLLLRLTSECVHFVSYKIEAKMLT
jgi:hypothetical protein